MRTVLCCNDVLLVKHLIEVEPILERAGAMCAGTATAPVGLDSNDLPGPSFYVRVGGGGTAAAAADSFLGGMGGAGGSRFQGFPDEDPGNIPAHRQCYITARVRPLLSDLQRVAVSMWVRD